MYLEAPVVARDKASLLIYVVVNYWAQKAQFDAGLGPTVINDFLMQLTGTVTQIQTIGGRWVRLDGVRIRPEDVTDADDAIGWRYETKDKTNAELVAEVEANVLSFWARAKANGWTGDRRTFHSVDEADPDGVLTKIGGFRNTKRDYPTL